jgi:hypothetical protein
VFLAAAGCSSDGAKPAPAGLLQLPPFVAEIAFDRASGVVGTVFSLDGSAANNSEPIAEWSWDFGDGQVGTGASVQHAYGEAGFFPVVVTATDARGDAVTASVLLAVFPAAGQPQVGIGGFPLPAVFGDVDGDGDLTLADCHLALRHARGLGALQTAAQILAADLDFDGEVEEEEAMLLAQAVAAGTPLPRRITPLGGPPGTGVNVISGALLDPEAIVQVQVGAAAPTTLFRPALGYGSFLVPFDAAPSGIPQLAGNTIAIRILVDGEEQDSFDFALEDPAPIDGEPGQEVRELLDQIPLLFAALRPALSNYMDVVGATGDERALLETFLLLAEQEYGTARPQFEEAFALLDDETRLRIHQVANANGLADALAEIRAYLETSQVQGSSGETLLQVLCDVPRIKELLEKADGVMGWVTNFVQVCALVPSPVQPVCAALVPVVVGFGTVSDVSGIVLSLTPSPDYALLVTAEPSTLAAGEQAEIRTFVRLRGAEALCATGVGLALKTIQEQLLGILVKKMFKRVGGVKLAAKILERYPLDKRGELREKVLEQLKSTMSFLIGKALDKTGLNKLLGDVQSRVCARLQDAAGPGAFTIALQNSNFLPPDPPDVGTLVPSAVGSTDPAIFTCDPPDGENHTVTLMVDRAGCDATRRFTGRVNVECSSAKANVKITIGDNGAALDDIYEARIDGVTVLTSSVPVTSISTTVQLAAGQHTLLLIGRAAPDFIGTYFMEIEGATVLSGPPLSGENLTAGTVFTYVIEVAP